MSLKRFEAFLKRLYVAMTSARTIVCCCGKSRINVD